MYLALHQLTVQLHSPDAAVRRHWAQLFRGWLVAEAPAVDVRLELALVDALPPLPAAPPFFADTGSLLDGVGILSVYRGADDGVRLHYLDGALVDVPLAAPIPGTPLVARGVLVKKAMQYGRFEDITFTSLAPLLRRRGFFLAHAFAACRPGHCALIVGPTGSGKTTTGLSLLLNGWELLSNDIVLLQQRDRSVYALPTPGIVNVRPGSLELLPGLQPLLARGRSVYGKHNLTGHDLTNGRRPAPCPVTHLFFPHVEQRPHSTRHYQNRAVALARLMAESMDRWDEATMPDHLNLLQRLVRQADAYALHLGQDMSQIPPLFAA